MTSRGGEASPYRSSGGSAEIAVACADCGALANLGAADGSFGCSACGHQQPSRRADLPEAPSSLKAESHVKASYPQLVAFARLVGVNEPCAQVRLLCDGVACLAGVAFASATVSGVEVGAAAQGLPPATFRRETTDDVDAKRSGVTREVETGDKAFDDFVYVESDAADGDLLILLSSPAVRAAIVRLLRRYETVSIDPSGVHAKTGGVHAEPGDFDPKNILAWLAAVRAIAGAPRPLQPAPRQRDPNLAIGAALLGVFTLGMGGTLELRAHFHPVGRGMTLASLALTAALWLAAQPLLKRALSGRHDSHKALYTGRIAAGALLLELSHVGLLLANALPDRSPEVKHEMVVESVDHNDDESMVSARLVGQQTFEPQLISFNDPRRQIKPGQFLTAATRQGALGWRWRSSPAVLRAGAVELRGR